MKHVILFLIGKCLLLSCFSSISAQAQNRDYSSLALNSHLVKPQFISHQKNSNSNVLTHLTEVASNTVTNFKQAGFASWYDKNKYGKKTINGETFDMNSMTASHGTLELGSYVRVTNINNGKSVIVRINDRKKDISKSMVDLSSVAAKKIGLKKQNLGKVVIEKVTRHAY